MSDIILYGESFTAVLIPLTKSNEISTFKLVCGIMTAVKDSPYKIISNTINIDYLIMDNTVNPVEGERLNGKITL